MAPGHSTSRNPEAERIRNDIITLAGQDVAVRCGNQRYGGVLLPGSSDLRVAIAVNGNYSDVRTATFPHIQDVDVLARSIDLKNYGNGGAGQ